jgi:hypothetical protein
MYKQVKNSDGTIANAIIRLSDTATIPFDPANTDYQEYLRWCEEGNEPEPADIASQVPAMENEDNNAV